MKTYPLSQPISAHGEEVTVLELREPTPADARAVRALPYVIGQDESVSINPAAAAGYVSRCANLPMSSVDQLAMADFNALCWEITGFFLTADGAKSTR